jgi:hypothetical protein
MRTKSSAFRVRKLRNISAAPIAFTLYVISLIGLGVLNQAAASLIGTASLVVLILYCFFQGKYGWNIFLTIAGPGIIAAIIYDATDLSHLLLIALVSSTGKVERTFRYGPYGENTKSEGCGRSHCGAYIGTADGLGRISEK